MHVGRSNQLDLLTSLNLRIELLRSIEDSYELDVLV